MRYEELDAALHAIRAAASDDPDLSAATQLRVRRSLEARARGRHQLVGLLTTVAILFAGTVSWALATGQISALWVPAAPAAHGPTPSEDADEKRESSAAPRSAPRPAVLMAVPPPPVLPPETVTPRAPIVSLPLLAPAELPAAAPRSLARVEVLYRAAHDLHFHGGAPVATLRAWDAYLAAEPAGRFAVEARYNRALILVRLGRHADASAALLPFARGAVDPAGYRQFEAEQLVERLGAAE